MMKAKLLFIPKEYFAHHYLNLPDPKNAINVKKRPLRVLRVSNTSNKKIKLAAAVVRLLRLIFANFLITLRHCSKHWTIAVTNTEPEMENELENKISVAFKKTIPKVEMTISTLAFLKKWVNPGWYSANLDLEIYDKQLLQLLEGTGRLRVRGGQQKELIEKFACSLTYLNCQPAAILAGKVPKLGVITLDLSKDQSAFLKSNKLELTRSYDRWPILIFPRGLLINLRPLHICELNLGSAPFSCECIQFLPLSSTLEVLTLPLLRCFCEITEQLLQQLKKKAPNLHTLNIHRCLQPNAESESFGAIRRQLKAVMNLRRVCTPYIKQLNAEWAMWAKVKDERYLCYLSLLMTEPGMENCTLTNHDRNGCDDSTLTMKEGILTLKIRFRLVPKHL